MQANLLNILYSAPTASNGTTVLNAGEGESDTAFADLLQQQQNVPASEKIAAPLAGREVPAAIAAQEIGRSVRDVLGEEITPEMALELLTTLDAFVAAGGGEHAGNNELYAQLREGLEQVAKGDQSVTLEQMVAETPALEPLLPTLPPAATVTQDEVQGPLMRVLAWVNQSLEKRKEHAQQADTQAQALAALSSGLPATMFRTGDAPDSDVAQKGPREKSEQVISDTLSVGLGLASPMQTMGVADALQPLPHLPSQALTPVALNSELAAAPVDSAVDVVEDVSSLVDTDAATPKWLSDMMQDIAARDPERAGVPLRVTPMGDTKLEDVAAVNLPEVNLPQLAVDAPEQTVSGAFDAEAWKKNLPFPLSRSEERGIALDAKGDELKLAAIADSKTIEVATPVAPAAPTPTAQKVHVAQAPATPYYLPQSPADQVRVAIRSATSDGADKITIQLEPADLGRVEIRMQVGQDGQTRIHMIADKSSTLDLLARDAYGLERSLAESGIKADAGSMQFNLRQEPQFGEAGGDSQRRSRGEPDEQAANDNAAMNVAINETVRRMTLQVSGGLDIHA